MPSPHRHAIDNLTRNKVGKVAWLWGIVGLVLSTPLTVCLVVLGRHVERRAFLDVMFGDAPPLTPVENFYQRMLTGDASEVVDQAEQFLKTKFAHRLLRRGGTSGFADGAGGSPPRRAR